MDGKKPFQYHKSPSRASRVVCETLNSEKLVWLAPVSSPLRSPSREKLQVARKKVRQGSIFALPRRSKVSMEAEEPMSPKVSCIGQVRTSKKNILADSKAGKCQHFKPSSASPARFFRSLSTKSKWVSLFRMQKDARRGTLSSQGHCAGKVNLCFGFTRDSPSGYNAGRSCSAFFAKSLLLLQDCEERAECSENGVAQMHSASHAQLHTHAHLDKAKNNPVSTIVPISRERLPCGQVDMHGFSDTHVLGEADTSLESMINRREESHACETMMVKHVHEMKLNTPTDLLDACAGITMETWSHQNIEDSKHNGALLVDGVCDESSRDVLRQAQAEEGSTSSSFTGECLSHSKEVLASSTSSAPMLEDDVSVKGLASTSNAPMLEDNIGVKPHSAGEVEASHVIDNVLSGSIVCDTENCGSYRLPLLSQLGEMDLLCFLGNGAPFIWVASSKDTFLLLESSLCKRFKCLEDEAKITRSHSATSYRTIIQLLRCKSVPGRVN